MTDKMPDLPIVFENVRKVLEGWTTSEEFRASKQEPADIQLDEDAKDEKVQGGGIGHGGDAELL